MESEMLSGIAQKAERTVEWKKKKQSVISTGISTPCTRDPKGCELCVQGGNCPLTRAGITVHSCEYLQPTTQPQLQCESPT